MHKFLDFQAYIRAMMLEYDTLPRRRRLLEAGCNVKHSQDNPHTVSCLVKQSLHEDSKSSIL